VLLYARDGRIAGSVSGGCVRGAAAEEIDRARATGHARVIRYGISDEEAWDVGLACGGTIDVLVEPVTPALVVDAARWLGRGRRARLGGRHATPHRLATGRVRSAPAG
jgi:xanthine dehydrogenase accessory factor